MNRAEKIKGLNSSIKRYYNKIDEYKSELDNIMKSVEVTIPELYKHLSVIDKLHSCNTEYFSIMVYEGDYVHILGGDGRSAPWDELRKGTICNVVTPIYLDKQKEGIIERYLKDLGKIDKIKINN